VFLGGITGGTLKWRLHPLNHTGLEYVQAQDIAVSQRFTGFGSLLLQTGHIFSVGLIIRLALHLGHLTERSLTRLISGGSEEMNTSTPFSS
jgi:hypothetical protein